MAGVLVASASPANAAVRGLVSGSRTGRVAWPWAELAVAVILLVLVVSASAAMAGRRVE
ncbi:hypothetical protein ACWGB8_03200 [Kitasatospora sp. NPDC054939]